MPSILTFEGEAQQRRLDIRRELVNALSGQEVRISDLHTLFQAWPQATSTHLAALGAEIDQTLNNLFPPGKRRSKLKLSDPALFGAMWWPYASLERLCIATYLSIWLFAWDDETDSREFSELATNFDEAQVFRAVTLDRIRMYLALEQEAPDQETYAALAASHRSILEQFAPIGREMVKHCALEQRKVLMQQIEFFVHMSEVEQRSQLNEHLPSVESYQRRRMGTSAVTVCLAIHEYTLDIRLPQHVFDSPLMQSLWDATNVIISVTNDILSVKKEIAQGQVDTLIPLLYISHGRNAQAAVDEATRMLKLAVSRFNLAANALLENNAGDKLVKADLARFIDSCRYGCTANLNWSAALDRPLGSALSIKLSLTEVIVNHSDGNMKHLIVWLAAVTLVHGSPHVFSVTDDLLAYPQYEVVFSDTFISAKEAQSHVAAAASRSPFQAHLASLSTSKDASTPEPASEVSQRLSDRDSPDPVTSLSYEHMILHQRPYLCSIPFVPPPSHNSTSHARALSEETAELARATDRGYDLLRSMSGSCLYFISGWWSYSFCYNDHVKQFHQLPPGKGTPIFPPVEDPATPSYVLGRFGEVRNRVEDGEGRGAGLRPEIGEEGRTTEIQAKGTSNSRYLSQKLSGGTTCDLTGSPRRVEIQFHCHPQSADRIGWIKEVSTCSYLLVVYTPRLCNDVAFLPPREDKAERIVCREVVKEEEVSEWEARKVKEAERKLVGGDIEDKGGRPIVGGIEVGGMKLVGREGKKLEAPRDVQPGSHGHGMHGEQELRVMELISQESEEAGGKIRKLSDRDLKKMGLDPNVVDAARKKLEEAAQGRGWKLEVFDVGGGRELRGVVDGDDEDGEGHEDGEEGSQEVYKNEL